jgi:hypothetical protein
MATEDAKSILAEWIEQAETGSLAKEARQSLQRLQKV